MTEKVITKTVYQTTIGECFDTLEEAQKHQAMIDANDKLLTDSVFYHGVINVSNSWELSEFLERNADWIKPMMGWK